MDNSQMMQSQLESVKQCKSQIQQILQQQIQQIRQSIDYSIREFEEEILNLIEKKTSKIQNIHTSFIDDYEEKLDNLKLTFEKGMAEMCSDVQTIVKKTFESHTFTSYFNTCLQEINGNDKLFDIYKFKFYSCVQPDKIQPRYECISQIFVLSSSQSALLYQDSQKIAIIDHNKQEIINHINTPFIKRIISSNSAASTLCYKTDREILTVNYQTKRVVRIFIINNSTDEMICACQLKEFVFAYATNFGRIWIVDLTTGEIITKLDGEIPSVLLKFNNKFLIAAGISRGIYLWDWRKNIVSQRFIGHNSRVNCVIKYDNDHILSCDQYGKIYMFRISTSIRCKQFIGHEKSVVKLLKLNNEFIASCSFDRTIRFWNVDQEICFRKLENHGNFVLDIAKCGKNKMLSTCLDKVLNVWG